MLRLSRTNLKPALRLNFILGAVWLSLASPAAAATSTWKTGGPSPDWFESLNWTAAVPQNSGDIANFNNAATANTQTQLNAPAMLSQLNYAGLGSFQLNGSGPL